jgi:phage tail sheath protein FI
MPEPPAVPADYVLETSTGVRVITSARTADAAFVGAMDGLAPGEHRRVHRYADFEQAGSPADRDTPLGLAIRQFFVNGGDTAHVFGRVAGPVDATRLRDALAVMVAALDLAAGETDAPDFQLLCVPEAFDLPEAEAIAFIDAAASVCKARRAFFIADVPRAVPAARAAEWSAQLAPSANAALYLPALRIAAAGSAGIVDVGPSGTLAGLYARTDAQGGVHRAPAGVAARLYGVLALAGSTDAARAGQLNAAGINTLRELPVHGRVAWGARTLAGADARASDWRYVPVRRLALHIERSLLEGTRWAVFEPNDETLWTQVRLNVYAFMHALFRQGAFQGTTTRDAYFVKCDAATTTAGDIANGVVNIEIGFAPLKPAEFLIVRIQQRTGSTTL